MKEKLRKKIMDTRKSLPDFDVLEKSKQIKKRLFEMTEFKKADTILFYVSYDNEVYTHDMIKESLSNGKNVVVPITDTKEHCLILSKLKRWEDLERSNYSILEPKKDCVHEVSLDDMEVVLVPGVVFDESGNRIGHGVGYYDKLLKNSKNAAHIGLAFEVQIVDSIPAEGHDVKVDRIVTEDRIIKCF
ncbi:MAG: 5-formyltetrahydrofolate cyclo-ligase [Euryarchaeota archaeon]|nr:5-formyltetrahydrofolate cyclo-ligase [Euryarchaeota archaeon]